MNIRISILVVLIGIIGLSTTIAQDKLINKRKLKRQITYTSIEEAQANPDEVYKLKLSNQKKLLKEIPVEVFQFKNLQELDVSTNQIKDIPAELFKLTNLQVLNISFNQIGDIPEGISRLKNLRVLLCKGCRLTTLPDGLGQLHELEELDLFANHITSFPEEMAGLKNLRRINIFRNRMSLENQEKVKAMFPDAEFVME